MRLLSLFLLLSFVFLFFFCKSAPVSSEQVTGGEQPAEEDIFDFTLPPEDETLKILFFPEIWAYVVAGRESALKPGMPLSDIGYFGAEINSYGSLVEVPDRRKLPAFNGRVHIVVKCDSRSLTHFVLKPGSTERSALIADLLAASKNYDGLQIDFEYVPARDGEPFFTFLKELRNGLGNKMFTIALAARTRKIADDVYDYEKIAPLVDRILVMAYDEHWSGSTPGSIASLPWCRRVAAHSLSVIGKEKLIMGLPFYGRGWASTNHSQAYLYTTVERIMKENNVTEIQREDGIPNFGYDATISAKVYYEDEYSLFTRMDMYQSMGVTAVGFWRLGQETPEVWKLLRLGK